MSTKADQVQGDTWEPKTEIIGPGYRAAYGLVALVHHQIEGVNERGEPQLMDHRIRTHGTAAYRAVKRGESNGCHRMHNYVVLRLASFLVKHPQRLGISVVCDARANGSEVPTPSGMA